MSLGGYRGTHGALRQRSVHVQVICSKRPVRSRSTVGAWTGWYGRKLAVTRSRDGSTHFVSATTAMLAVTGSPNRCTGGVSVVYALSGTPSPIDEPDGSGGSVAAAGAAAASATAAATSSRRLMRPALARAPACPPSGGTR